MNDEPKKLLVKVYDADTNQELHSLETTRALIGVDTENEKDFVNVRMIMIGKPEDVVAILNTITQTLGNQLMLQATLNNMTRLPLFQIPKPKVN